MVENSCLITDKIDSSFFSSKESSLNFIYLNVRSLRRNFDLFLANIHSLDCKVDLIILSETWIFDDEVGQFKIPGFNMFFNCNQSYRAGGIIAYVKDHIRAHDRVVRMETADILILEINYCNILFNLIGAYRLQSFTELDFISELGKVFAHLDSNVIFIGDINLDIRNKSNLVDKYMSLMSNNGFSCMVDAVTRQTQVSATCIDHIFVRFKNINIFKSAVFEVNITDHFMLGLVMSIDEYMCNNILRTSKCITKIDFEGLKQSLMQDHIWVKVLNSSDVNVALDEFYNIINRHIEQNTSTRTVNNKLIKAKCKSPWINGYIIGKINKRNKLSKILRNSPYNQNLKEYFNSFKENLDNEISMLKNQYYKNLFLKNEGNITQQWKIINNLTGNRDKKEVDRLQVAPNQFVSDPQVIADKFIDYFISAPGRLVTGLPNHHQTDTTRFSRHAETIFLTPVTKEEIENIINGLKNKRSTGCDALSVALVKHINPVISEVLADLVNLSFLNGEFPEKLKEAIIVPIYKKGGRDFIEHYRPIALLSILAKIFEKCMKCRLLNFLERKGFFSKKQFGFTKGKNTEQAVSNLTERIFNSFNCDEKASSIFIDFCKAFDLVNHNILLTKLELLGIRGKAGQWCRTYLENRPQRVKVADYMSSIRYTNIGVPQGSVLSATLFIIFINDLLNEPLKGEISAFADDVVVRYSCKNWDVLWGEMEEDLKIIGNWCLNNKMIVNATKTKFIAFDLKGFAFDKQLKFHSVDCGLTNVDCNCEIVEQVKQIKYLGIWIDEKMSWKIHVENLQLESRRNIRKFYFLRNILNEHLMRTLYFALIHSKIVYGIENWGSADEYIINSLQVTQNHFIRIISFKQKKDSALPIFKKLKILPVRYLYVFKVLKMFYLRSGNKKCDIMYQRSRSFAQGLYMRPKVNKSIFRKTITYTGPKFFNVVPIEIRSISKVGGFIKKIKEWLLNIEDIKVFFNILS